MCAFVSIHVNTHCCDVVCVCFQVVFRRPSKRQAAESSGGISASTKKRKESDDIKEKSSAKKSGVKNASLLSFCDNEDSD